MKFFSLVKKEFKEIMNLQNLLGLVVMIVMLFAVGSIMGSVGSNAKENSSTIVVADMDKSDFSAAALDALRQEGVEPILIDLSAQDNYTEFAELAAQHEKSSGLIIPKGFGEGITGYQTQTLAVVGEIKSFSVFSNMDSSASEAADIITEFVTSSTVSNAVGGIDTEYIKQPIAVNDVSVIKGKSTNIPTGELVSLLLSQSIFVPIIIFLLLMMAAQLNVSAIANEKVDKTLETLLSTPVSRLSVLSAKMIASAGFSLLSAVVYMVGFSSYMSGVMGMASGGELNTNLLSGVAPVSLADIGMSLSGWQYVLVGIQLFLTVSIGLVISLMLGALSKDLKSAQGMITPLMIVTILPFLVTMLTDVNTLPMVGKVILYLIPFTHTFTASANLLFDNNLLYWMGVIYQALFLCGTLFVAIRVFSSDKIFTASFSVKKRGKKAAISE